MQKWALQDAKSKFSEVVRLAVNEQPQTITLRGEEVAVLLSKEEYEALISSKPTFLELMQTSPFKDLNIEFEREESPPREIEL